MRDGITERANADLQCAAVGHEARGMHCSRIVGRCDASARHGEKWKVVVLSIEKQI